MNTFKKIGHFVRSGFYSKSRNGVFFPNGQKNNILFTKITYKSNKNLV